MHDWHQTSKLNSHLNEKGKLHTDHIMTSLSLFSSIFVLSQSRKPCSTTMTRRSSILHGPHWILLHLLCCSLGLVLVQAFSSRMTKGFFNRVRSPTQRLRSLALSRRQIQDVKAMTDSDPPTDKNITFLRHSTTYMNEYLGRSLRFGAPDFTDVFADSKEREAHYRDTPLSPSGIQWAKQSLQQKRQLSFLEEDGGIDLIVTSPLRRAMQTFEVGMLPHFSFNQQPSSSSPTQQDKDVHLPPILAHPDAAERLYLISDVGHPSSVLQEEFPYIDFRFCQERESSQQQQSSSNKASSNPHPWWWTPTSSKPYHEWRPHGRGQKYACPGEPPEEFDERMTRFTQWLHERPEQNILVICHHGVIEWMLDLDFDNCQWEKVPFSSIRQHAK